MALATIPDGLPIQFYLEGEPTYNEEIAEEVYVEDQCFHQEWKCSKEMVLRFPDPQIMDLILRAKNEKGIQIGDDLPFIRTPITSGDFNQIQNGNFASGLDLWTTNTVYGGGAKEFVYTGGQIKVNLTAFEKSKDLKQVYNMSQGRTYNFKLTAISPGAALRVYLFGRNSNTAYTVSVNQALVMPLGAKEFNFSLTPAEDCDEVFIVVERTTGGFGFLSVTNVTLEVTSVVYGGVYALAFTPAVQGICSLMSSLEIWDVTGAEERVAKTDPVVFNENTTWLEVQYKSKNSFGGMYYDVDSPYFTTYFNAQFAKGRDQSSVTSVRLSNSVTVNTSSELYKQRKLIVEYMAEYMATKLLIILMHGVSGSVLIKGKEWTWEEEFNYIDSSAVEFIMSGGEIWLTRKNYSIQNVN